MKAILLGTSLLLLFVLVVTATNTEEGSRKAMNVSSDRKKKAVLEGRFPLHDDGPSLSSSEEEEEEDGDDMDEMLTVLEEEHFFQAGPFFPSEKM